MLVFFVSCFRFWLIIFFDISGKNIIKRSKHEPKRSLISCPELEKKSAMANENHSTLLRSETRLIHVIVLLIDRVLYSFYTIKRNIARKFFYLYFIWQPLFCVYFICCDYFTPSFFKHVSLFVRLFASKTVQHFFLCRHRILFPRFFLQMITILIFSPWNNTSIYNHLTVKSVSKKLIVLLVFNNNKTKKHPPLLFCSDRFVSDLKIHQWWSFLLLLSREIIRFPELYLLILL